MDEPKLREATCTQWMAQPGSKPSALWLLSPFLPLLVTDLCTAPARQCSESFRWREGSKLRSNMWPVWSNGWRKSTRVTGKSLFLRKEPAEPHTENRSGPYNTQGSWHRAQREDFWTVEVVHEPPMGCLLGDQLKSNTQDSRSQGKLWGTQYVGQGKRMCLSTHNSPWGGREKIMELSSRVLFMPSQAHPSSPVTSTQSSSGHCSCPFPRHISPTAPCIFFLDFTLQGLSWAPLPQNPLDTPFFLLGPSISPTWFLAVLQKLEREKLFS